MTKFDLISIGDNATDAFIRLQEAELNCQINKPECQICMKFASKIPYEAVTEIPAGGNSANVVLGATKLGLKTAYISQVGGDRHGQNCLAKLQTAGVNTDLITVFPDQISNYNYVLWYQDDRTILVKHQDFPKIWPHNLEAPQWVFLSSINDKDLSFHLSISDWLRHNENIKLAFSPGSIQLRAGAQKLREIYEHTEIFFSNYQEAEKVLESREGDPRQLTEKIRSLGPKIVVITNGEKGSYCLDKDDNLWFMPASSSEAHERTGAGDAFASAFLSAIFYEQDIPTALAWATTNAGSVVTKIGPHEGLLDKTQLEKKIIKDKLEAKII